MNRLTDTAAELASSVHQMINEAERVLKIAAQSGDAKFDGMRDRFLEQACQVRAQLDDFEGAAARRLRRAGRSADRAVHTHPYAAVGIAAVAALLIGLLASRR